mmetsp:Transcript_24760/g.39921  ORF Transcript_24760/g.39921 Transcript_24760/m.39921 type:complete len:86 (-) Transcript_24760:14-271(-)
MTISVAVVATVESQVQAILHCTVEEEGRRKGDRKERAWGAVPIPKRHTLVNRQFRRCRCHRCRVYVASARALNVNLKFREESSSS